MEKEIKYLGNAVNDPSVPSPPFWAAQRLLIS